MPDWVLKHKIKGYTIRLNGKNFCLYKISSYRDHNYNYPRIKQDYIGIITKDGVMPKKVVINNESFKEFGLSYFLYLNFKRELKRSIYGEDDDNRNVLVVASIISYMFGSISNSFLSLTHLSELSGVYEFNNLTPRRIKIIDNLKDKLNLLIYKSLPNDTRRAILLFSLRSITSKVPCQLPENIKKQIRDVGLRYE
jgi:hypothetical protein